MTFSIRQFFLSLVICTLSLTTPAYAQNSSAGIEPVRVEGQVSISKVQDICGLTNIAMSLEITELSGVKGSGNFKIELALQAKELAFKDESDVNQQNGTPGIEAIAVWSDHTNVYCYPTRIRDSGLGEPDGDTPKGVTIIWGPGPCLLPQGDVEKVCNAYSASGHKVDYFVGLKHGPDETNVCGCSPVQTQACDATEPPGSKADPNVDSCNPEGEPLKWLESTAAAATGTSSHDAYCPPGTRPVHYGGRPMCLKL